MFLVIEDTLYENENIKLPEEFSLLFKIFEQWSARFHTHQNSYSVPWFSALVRAVTRLRRPTLADFHSACLEADKELNATNRASSSSASSKSYSKSSSTGASKSYSSSASKSYSSSAGQSRPPYGTCAICSSPGHWWKSCPQLPSTGPPSRSRYYSDYANRPAKYFERRPPTAFPGPVTAGPATGGSFKEDECCSIFNSSEPWKCKGSDKATCREGKYHRCSTCLDGSVHRASDAVCPANKAYKDRVRRGI